MPVNQNPIIVTDIETGGKDPFTCEVVEIAAKVYHPRTLEPLEYGEFESLIKPENEGNLDPESMRIHKIPIAELRQAPELKAVWLNYVKFINRFNYRQNDYSAPIMAGKNIRGFDCHIIERLKKKLTPDARLFSTYWMIDLENLMWPWFESNSSLVNYKIETVLDYFRMKDNGDGSYVHRAMFDCRQEGELIMRILKLHRNLLSKKTTAGTSLITFRQDKRNIGA